MPRPACPSHTSPGVCCQFQAPLRTPAVQLRTLAVTWRGLFPRSAALATHASAGSASTSPPQQRPLGQADHSYPAIKPSCAPGAQAHPPLIRCTDRCHQAGRYLSLVQGLTLPGEACSKSYLAVLARPAIKNRPMPPSAIGQHPEHRSNDGQVILKAPLAGRKPEPDLLVCRAPLRNRTVDLLLTISTLGRPGRPACTDGAQPVTTTLTRHRNCTPPGPRPGPRGYGPSVTLSDWKP
jgi:hypothetical protein